MCYNLAEWLKENLPEFFPLKNLAANHDSENVDVLGQPDAKNVASRCQSHRRGDTLIGLVMVERSHEGGIRFPLYHI